MADPTGQAASIREHQNAQGKIYYHCDFGNGCTKYSSKQSTIVKHHEDVHQPNHCRDCDEQYAGRKEYRQHRSRCPWCKGYVCAPVTVAEHKMSCQHRCVRCSAAHEADLSSPAGVSWDAIRGRWVEGR